MTYSNTHFHLLPLASPKFPSPGNNQWFLLLDIGVHSLEFYENEIIVHELFFGLVFFTHHNYFEIHSCWYLCQINSYLLMTNIPLYSYTINHWWTFGLLPSFSLLQTKLLWTFMYKLLYKPILLFLMDKYLDMEFLSHVVL